MLRAKARFALVAGLVCLGATARDAAAQPAGDAKPADATGISEQARKHFAAGVALLQDPDGEKVEEAYREFKTAYDLSHSPKVLGNMGLCAMRLERDGEAIDAYSQYLREVKDIDPDERAQIVRDLETLSVGVARITIEVDKPGARLVDVRSPVRGERITNVYGPFDGKTVIGLRPGHHVITAKVAGYEDATWELEAYAGGRDRYAFTMKAPAAPIAAPSATEPGVAGKGGSSHVGPWIVLGTGAAMLVAGAVTGVVALGKTSDIEDRCPDDRCQRGFDLESERSNAKTFVRVTDALLIAGGVVTAGGLGWLFFDSRGEKPTPKPGSARLTLPSASCGLDGCRATWGMTF